MAEITPNMATTSAAGLTPLPSDSTEVLWAMDIDDSYQPVRAHKIVAVEQAGLVRVTACGLRLTALNHPLGWWQMAYGALPLQPQHVHCGTGG